MEYLAMLAAVFLPLTLLTVFNASIGLITGCIWDERSGIGFPGQAASFVGVLCSQYSDNHQFGPGTL